MEIQNFVDYPNVPSFEGYNIRIHPKEKWNDGAAIADVTMGEGHVLPCYTLDDVTDYNKAMGQRAWFKYGQKVYSIEKIKIALKAFRPPEKEDEPDDSDTSENSFRPAYNNIALDTGYPVYTLRKSGIGRQELKVILDKAVVGTLVQGDKYTRLVKFKNWVEDVLKGLKASSKETRKSRHIGEFKDQLNRWLNDYPCVENDRYKHPVNCVDHNDNFFPLPAQIMCNPLVLRQWTEDWQTFDCDVPKEGAWHMQGLLNEDIGDTHEVFANVVKSHVDDTMEDFDMEIDGEAAWGVLEEDVVKNDKTTPEQDKIWEAREHRTKIGDREWMRKRRKEIADRLAKRHHWTQDKLAPYMACCDNLDQSWNTFQNLCCD